MRYAGWLAQRGAAAAARPSPGSRSASAAGSRCWACSLTGLGLRDARQTRHAALRNYPVIGHLRFLLEFIRPEIRQYFIESRPRGRAVLAPAALAGLPARQGRGRQAALRHAARRARRRLRVDQPLDGADRARRATTSASTIGAAARARSPTAASVFNISAMSFGALSANAILALNEGAKRGGFAHDTGEGSISAPPPRARRRPDLGDRLRLLRLPRRRRPLQRRALRRATRATRR
ncbi:MAG: glutamate synthase-related protein [Comamonadaceae bacterium]|nr:glutamate synthase-related protein [Comamonadaceae bacterium]